MNIKVLQGRPDLSRAGLALKSPENVIIKKN